MVSPLEETAMLAGVDKSLDVFYTTRRTIQQFLKLTISKRLNFVKISLDLISPVYYRRGMSVNSVVSSLRRKIPFVS